MMKMGRYLAWGAGGKGEGWKIGEVLRCIRENSELMGGEKGGEGGMSYITRT